METSVREEKRERVMVYVDGFNLYFGMKEISDATKWLDIKKLALSRLKGNQVLAGIKYFTSYISNDIPKERRQKIYLDALLSTGVLIIKGKYESKKVICEKCNHTWYRTNEKKTDVNIATSIILDALKDRFDVAMLISGDSDLVPAINMVSNEFHPKYVTVAFPPNRHNKSVADAATGSFILGRQLLLNCQFDENVKDGTGFILKKPAEWK